MRPPGTGDHSRRGGRFAAAASRCPLLEKDGKRDEPDDRRAGAGQQATPWSESSAPPAADPVHAHRPAGHPAGVADRAVGLRRHQHGRGRHRQAHSDTINQDIGAPTQALFQQLHRSARTPSPGRARRAGCRAPALDAQRERTDAAVAAFRPAAAAAAGVRPGGGQAGTAALAGKLSQLPDPGRGRRGQDGAAGRFEDYNDITDACFTFFRGGWPTRTAASRSTQQGEGAVDEGQAVEYIGREATLVGGALAAGGLMSAAEHQLFVQAIGPAAAPGAAGESPLYWQQTPTPTSRVFASPAYAGFKALEDRIAATAPGAPVPVSPARLAGGAVGRGGVRQRRGRRPGVGHQGRRARGRRDLAPAVPRRRRRAGSRSSSPPCSCWASATASPAS